MKRGIVIREAKVAFCDVYIAKRNVMVVGDGDFSFSREIVAGAACVSDPGFFCTSVLPTEEDLVNRYKAKNSPIMDNLAWFQDQDITHHFGVDATRLTETAAWSLPEPCGVVVWTYPFPENNAGDMATKQSLIDAFFQSIKEWQRFSATGIVVLGLKSCSMTTRHSTDDEDYQLREWGIEDIAAVHGFRIASFVGPMVPFWSPTHVSGRPLCRKKERAMGQIKVKFYGFQRQPTE